VLRGHHAIFMRADLAVVSHLLESLIHNMNAQYIPLLHLDASISHQSSRLEQQQLQQLKAAVQFYGLEPTSHLCSRRGDATSPVWGITII
jgi:hypothetical protein